MAEPPTEQICNSEIIELFFDLFTGTDTDIHVSGEFKLFEIYTRSHAISSEEVITEMKNEGYRPANIFELLLFASDASENRCFGEYCNRIIALGSTVRFDCKLQAPKCCYWAQNDGITYTPIFGWLGEGPVRVFPRLNLGDYCGNWVSRGVNTEHLTDYGFLGVKI